MTIVKIPPPFDDRVVIGFESDTYDVNEDAGTVELTAKVLTGSLGRIVTLDYRTIDGTALAGEDYTYSTGTVTLSPMATSVTFTVRIIDDLALELPETFTVVLSSMNLPVGVTLDPATATVTINDDRVAPPPDDDMVVIGFDPDMYTVDEGAGTIELTVKVLSGSLGRDVTLTYETMDGTAVVGEDYTYNMGTITLSSSVTEEKIVVSITDDALLENAEMFTVVLRAEDILPVGVTLDPATATVTINDDRTPPPDDTVVIGFEPDTYSVYENAGTVELTVKLISGSLGRVVTLTYETMDGTALASEDYTSTVGTITLSPTDTSVTFTVPIRDDRVFEFDEMFTVVLSSMNLPVGVTLNSAVATVTIADDDKPTLRIESVERLEEGDSTLVTVSLSNAATHSITISLTGLTTTKLTTPAVTTIGTVESSDYTILDVDSMIPAGQLIARFTLEALDDGRELDEILTLQASAAGLESVTRTVTITGTADAIILGGRLDRSYLVCEDVDSGLQACVKFLTGTVVTTQPRLFLEIDKANKDQKANIIEPANLPIATTLLDDSLIWDISFVDDKGRVVETLSTTVRIEFTASKDLVDMDGGLGAVSIATLHSGSTDWVVLSTSYSSTVEKTSTSKAKYRFTAFAENFSFFTLIVPVTATLSPSVESVQEGQSIDLVIELTAPPAGDVVVTLEPGRW